MDVPRALLHLDMDAFFAAVEQRDRPELCGLPVIVGADPHGGRGRGVVSTASYEARRFGVGSAMPISQAYRLCPQGIYVPVDGEKYGRVSEQLMEILRRFTDLVEPLSIDEAFLDVTGSRRAMGTAELIARNIKATIQEELRLTASVGVATCKLIAKVASDMRKPDGLVVVPAGTEADFLAPLPIRRLWGVGPKTEERLARLGIHTIGDLAGAEPTRLERRLGHHGHDLIRLAKGIDDRPVAKTLGAARSIGQEHTFEEDTRDPARLRRTLLGLADGVARRLRQHELAGRTVTLKYRDSTFRTVMHGRTLREPTDRGDAIFAAVQALFEEVHGSRHVRLLGIYVSGFEPSAQLTLFTKDAPPSPVDRLQDLVAERFGKGKVIRATLLSEPDRPSRREAPSPPDSRPAKP